jgi:hypothetical protein
MRGKNYYFDRLTHRNSGPIQMCLLKTKRCRRIAKNNFSAFKQEIIVHFERLSVLTSEFYFYFLLKKAKPRKVFYNNNPSSIGTNLDAAEIRESAVNSLTP